MPASLELLQSSAHKVLRLPAAAQQVVDSYLRLRVGGAEAACPYHIKPGLRSANRALLGKGNPAEIIALAEKCFKRYDMHVGGDGARLRSFLLACGIGV